MRIKSKKNYTKKYKYSRKNNSKQNNSKKHKRTRKYSQRSGMMRSSSINRITQSSKNVYSKSKDIAKKMKDVGEDVVTEIGKEQIKTGVKMAINPRKSFATSSFTPMKKQVNILDKNYTNKLSNINKNNQTYSLDLDEYDTYKTPNLKKNNINFGETSPEKNYNNEDNYNNDNMNILSPYQKTRELNTIKKNLDFDNED